MKQVKIKFRDSSYEFSIAVDHYLRSLPLKSISIRLDLPREFTHSQKIFFRMSSRVASTVSRARERELESIRLRKQILKAKGTGCTPTFVLQALLPEGASSGERPLQSGGSDGGGSVSSNVGSNDLFSKIEESANQYSSRLAMLTKFKTKSKTKTTSQLRKSEWLKEQVYLQGLMHSLERDVSEILASILVQCPTNKSLLEITTLDEQLLQGRSDNQKGITSQLKEIKMMMKDTIKGAEKSRGASAAAGASAFGKSVPITTSTHVSKAKTTQVNESNNNNNDQNTNTENSSQGDHDSAQSCEENSNSNDPENVDDDDGPPTAAAAAGDNIENEKINVMTSGTIEKMEHQDTEPEMTSHDITSTLPAGPWTAAISIFADVLMQVRSHHNQTWSSLKSTEEALSKSITADRLSIVRSMQGYLLEEQNTRLKLDFAMRDDDDIEVEMFMQDWFRKIQELDNGLDTDLKAIAQERLQALQLCGVIQQDSTEEECVLAGKWGGWTQEDHEIFAKVYKRAQTSGAQRKVLSANLSTQLPHKTSQELANYEAWYRAVCAIANKKKDVVTRHKATREAMIKQGKEELDKFRESIQAKHDNERKMKEHEDQRIALHERLDKLREEKQKVDDLLKEEERKRRSEEAERLNQLEEASKREAALKKQQVEEFKRAKQLLQAAQKRLEEEKARAELEAIKKQVEENKWKVELREQRRLDKEEERRKKEEELAAEEGRRLELLMKLAQQVPYWENMQNIQSKLDHITASAKGWEYIPGEEMSRGFLPINGFADVKVIRDARHRLATALRAAGLQHSDAAKEAVARFHPRPHLAIHASLGIL